MKILLDHCVDHRLKRLLTHHEVSTAKEMGWQALKNGALLDEAQSAFDVLLTVDQNIQYQQNLQRRSLAVIILAAPNNRLASLVSLIADVEALLPTVQPGQFYVVTQVRTPPLTQGQQPEQPRSPSPPQPTPETKPASEPPRPKDLQP